MTAAAKHTPKLSLRGRALIAADGSIAAEIIGTNDGTTRRAPNSFGGYGYRLANGEQTTRDWPYFADAVRAARAAIARATGKTKGLA